MCGFIGAFSYDGNIEPLVPGLLSGLAKINHRGPDASNHLNLDSVFLGHNRLTIIDLSETANQPIKSKNTNAYIVFNGEIYNYKDLKTELEDNGTQFSTSSDTEVILEGYLYEGPSFFTKLRGIYAFAIYDKRKTETIILARDPSGIKPLYWFKNNDFFIFGSEMKALIPSVKKYLTINEEVIKMYLNLSFCPEPYTIYNNMEAVPPGSYFEISKSDFAKKDFLTFNFNSENSLSLDENINITKEKLRNAVKSNLVADVEIMVALSGGIDSSLVYALSNEMSKGIKGLTVSFVDSEYDEAKLAQEYAKHLKGNQVLIPMDKDFSLDQLKRIIKHFDQPYADSSAIPMYYLTRATAKYAKVLLGGDGGDELYNGYQSQTMIPFLFSFSRFVAIRKLISSVLKIVYLLAKGHKKRTIKRLRGLFLTKPAGLMYENKSWLSQFTMLNGESPFLYDPGDGLRIYLERFSKGLPDMFSHKVLYDSYRNTLQSDYLRKTDMMSMLNSVEYRVPLLYEDLVSFALTIPHTQKSDLKQGKKILRAIHAGIFPFRTSNAPKKGFSIPLDMYLTDEDLEIIKSAILNHEGIVTKYIRRAYVEYLFDSIGKRSNNSPIVSRAGIYQQILMFYSLHLWYEDFRVEINDNQAFA